jgi:polyhydroxybutyrate depolymerase
VSVSGRRASVALLLALLAGCGAGATASKPPPRQAAAPCFRSPGHQEVAGELVDIPRRLPKHPPLLIVFHGLRESVDYIAGETGFDGLAAKHGFVVAYPNAHAAQRWQLNRRDGDQDVDHMRSFIAAAVKRVCADRRRVYLTGFSNGGGFTFRAGCDLAAQVAAIAPVSGSYSSHDPCPAGTAPMPTLELHGLDPWTNTVARLITETKARNGCTRGPVTTTIARGITRTRWPGCNLERIYNRTIGHEWPRRGPYDTSAEVWRFVSRFRR